jgi:hypothetical protein
MKRISYLIICTFLFVGVAFGASQQTSSTTAATIVDRAEVWLNDTDNRFWSAGELLQWLNEGMIDIVSRSHCLQETESINLIPSTLEYSVTSAYLTVTAVHYVNASATVKGLLRGNPMSVGNVEDVAEPVFWYDWAGKIGVYPTYTDVLTDTITDTTIAFVDSDPDTITDSGTGFVTAGFSSGMQIYVSGTTNNDGLYTISAVVAGTITLINGDSLTAEGTGNSFTVENMDSIKIYLVTRPTTIASSANVTTPAIYDTALTMYMVAQAWLKDLKMNKYLQTMALYNAEMARIRQDLNQSPAGVIE